MSDIVTVNESNWGDVVKGSTTPVLVDFFAEWCGPCKQLHPTIERVAAKFKGRATVAQCDVDRNSGLSGRLGVQAMPTVFVFPPGSEEPAEKLVGVNREDVYSRALDRLLPLWGDQ